MLAFGAVYSAGGQSAQHRGADLEASDGVQVLAPFSGRVSFAGSVPGVGGGRVVAVTIETARGKVTLLPLDHASVARGDELAEGAVVGPLAANGDGSSASTHLHVGMREGDLYVDPLAVMAPATPPTTDQSSGVGVGAGSGVTVDAGVSVGSTGAGVTLGAGGTMPAGVSLAPQASTARAPRTRSARGGQGASSAVSTARVARVAEKTGVTAGSSAAQAVPLVLGTGGVFMPAAAASGTPAPPATSVVAWLLERAGAVAARTIRLAGLVLLGVLAGVGALWPLWRGEGRKGPGQLRVRVLGDDVAAAPSR